MKDWVRELCCFYAFLGLCSGVACYQVVSTDDVKCAELRCYPDGNPEVTAAWCDPMRFHIVLPVEGGTVTVSGGGLPVNLKCPVNPAPCPVESSITVK